MVLGKKSGYFRLDRSLEMGRKALYLLMKERIQPLFSSLLNETIWALVTGLCGKILLTGGALFTGGRGGSESLGVPRDCEDRKNSLHVHGYDILFSNSV